MMSFIDILGDSHAYLSLFLIILSTNRLDANQSFDCSLIWSEQESHLICSKFLSFKNTPLRHYVEHMAINVKHLNFYDGYFNHADKKWSFDFFISKIKKNVWNMYK